MKAHKNIRLYLELNIYIWLYVVYIECAGGVWEGCFNACNPRVEKENAKTGGVSLSALRVQGCMLFDTGEVRNENSSRF